MSTILIIDDDESFGESLEIVLSEMNYEILRATDGLTGIEIFSQKHPDLLITDLKMPGLNGMEVLNKVRDIDDSVPVVMITAFDDMETTIKAIQSGAYDYIEKSLEIERIKSIVKRALESKSLSDRLVNAFSEENVNFNPDSTYIGKTPAMRSIIKNIGKISANKVNVLIQGESGTGKELITKIIHYTGVTKLHPFVPVNCTALSENLLESELFGHVRGSFTGAVRDKKGKFELAGEGTIFLDEISEISPNLQVKLLRVLQEKEFERVGGETTIPMKARVVAASNRNLAKLVEAGKFREDLYYRLKVFMIDVPRFEKEEKIYLVSLSIF